MVLIIRRYTHSHYVYLMICIIYITYICKQTSWANFTSPYFFFYPVGNTVLFFSHFWIIFDLLSICYEETLDVDRADWSASWEPKCNWWRYGLYCIRWYQRIIVCVGGQVGEYNCLVCQTFRSKINIFSKLWIIITP